MRKIKTAKAAKPATVKPVIAAVAAKPVQAAAGTVKPDRSAIIDACRTHVAALYNGASLTVHAKRAAPLAAYLAVIKSPNHKCGPSGASTRDESLLSLIASKSDAKTHAFDPVALFADIGVISRLASIGFIAVSGDTVTLTDRGAERARLVAKRAA